MEKAIKNAFIEKWVKYKNEQGASIDLHNPEIIGCCPECGTHYYNTEPFCSTCGKVLDETLTGKWLDEDSFISFAIRTWLISPAPSAAS